MEMTQLLIAFEIVTGVVAFSTLMTIIIKPLREKIFNLNRSKEGERCLLRSEMLRIYYQYLDSKKIRQYEFENFIKLYQAYKALGGNSFIDEIYQEVTTWTVVR